MLANEVRDRVRANFTTKYKLNSIAQSTKTDIIASVAANKTGMS
jgi:hypothetical protein